VNAATSPWRFAAHVDANQQTALVVSAADGSVSNVALSGSGVNQGALVIAEHPAPRRTSAR